MGNCCFGATEALSHRPNTPLLHAEKGVRAGGVAVNDGGDPHNRKQQPQSKPTTTHTSNNSSSKPVESYQGGPEGDAVAHTKQHNTHNNSTAGNKSVGFAQQPQPQPKLQPQPKPQPQNTQQKPASSKQGGDSGRVIEKEKERESGESDGETPGDDGEEKGIVRKIKRRSSDDINEKDDTDGSDPGWSDDEVETEVKIAKTMVSTHKPYKQQSGPIFPKLESTKVSRRTKEEEDNHEDDEESENHSDRGAGGLGGSGRRALPSHMREKRFKAHSTATNYVSSSLSSPDLDMVLWCMASALYSHITTGAHAEKQVTLDLFDETIHPLEKGLKPDIRIPRVKIIYKYLCSMFHAEKLPPECAILCLAYIERLIQNTGITMCGTNWRRILLSALILASKAWEEQAVWNVDFLSVFPSMSVFDLNKLESFFLESISYNVSLKASEYAKYYFELRELAEREERNFPLSPLESTAQQNLEKRTKKRERIWRKSRRFGSMEIENLKLDGNIMSM